MSAEDYRSQQAENNRTMQHAVADSIEGLSPDEVTDITVSDSPASAKTSSMRGAGTRALAVGDVCYVQYTVTVRGRSTSLAAVRAELLERINSGHMQQALLLYAEQFGATAMANATVSASIDVFAADENNRFVDHMQEGEIAGTVVGGVLFLSLLFGVVWYFVLKKSYGHQWWEETVQVDNHL